MRVSGYLIGHPLSGQNAWILLHGYSGALDKVSARIGEFLMDRRGHNLSEEELESISPQLAGKLIERGFLTHLGAAEERELLIAISKAMHEADLLYTPANFMLIPAYTCNLRCPYCFQSHDMHEGRGRFATLMSPQQVDWALAIRDQFAARGAVPRALGLPGTDQPAPPFKASRRIGLFGGEPLAMETRSIVDYIAGKVTARGDSLSAVTNGVELQLFEDLIGPGLIEELQITLDGPQELHDKRRVGPRYRHSFSLILDNIDLALRRGAQVAVRINVDRNNFDSLGGLDGLFDERGWTANPLFMAYAAAVQDTAPKDPAERSRTEEDAGEVLRTFPKAYRIPTLSEAELVEETISMGRRNAGSVLRSYERYARDVIRSCLSGDSFPYKQGGHCSAETGLFIFDPFGDVYACWEEAGVRDRRIATYDEAGIDFDTALARQWFARFPGGIEQCSQCPYALVHTAGCAKHAREASGTLMASACESFQSYFPQTLAAVYEAAERQIFDTG